MSVCPHAACNITVKCRARIWWAVCAMHGFNMKKNFIVYILKHTLNAVKCDKQIAGIENYTCVLTGDCNMISCKIF